MQIKCIKMQIDFKPQYFNKKCSHLTWKGVQGDKTQSQERKGLSKGS